MKKFTRPKLVGDEYLILFTNGGREIRHAVCAASAVAHVSHDKVGMIQLVHRLPCRRYVYCDTRHKWVEGGALLLKDVAEPESRF